MVVMWQHCKGFLFIHSFVRSFVRLFIDLFIYNYTDLGGIGVLLVKKMSNYITTCQAC